MYSYENPEEQVPLLRMNSELEHAQLELQAHTAPFISFGFTIPPMISRVSAAATSCISRPKPPAH